MLAKKQVLAKNKGTMCNRRFEIYSLLQITEELQNFWQIHSSTPRFSLVTGAELFKNKMITLQYQTSSKHYRSCWLCGNARVRLISLTATVCSDQNWSRSHEDGLVVCSWCSLVSGEFWISKRCFDVLLGALSDNISVGKNDSLDNVDGLSSGTVSTSHFTEHEWYGGVECGSSVLLVHVYNILSGSVFKDDTEVLDGSCLSLEDFTEWNDLSLALSDLVLSLHFIPELGSSKNCVLCEDSNSVQGWLWISLTWELSANNPILTDLYNTRKKIKIWW